MSDELCHLCGKTSPLQDSHIIPKFVFRWMKKTGATDYLRFGANPNRRAQDGIKLKLLCADCEQRFSSLEKRFSEEVFREFTAGNFPRGSYSNWLSLFAASLVWRVAKSQELRAIDWKMSVEQMEASAAACAHWRRFLISKEKSPKEFELHWVPIGFLNDISDPKAPTNWNRYTLRHVEMDFIASDSNGFMAQYCKLGPIAFFGILRNTQQPWKGSRLSVNHGYFSKEKYIWPPMLLDFFFERARNNDAISRSMSTNQKNIVARTVEKDLDRYAASDLFKATKRDADRFGAEAVVYKTNELNEDK